MGTRVNMRPTNKNTMLKVVILGDGGVGKSCLMNRFVSNHFDEHSFHTIGVEFLNKDIDIGGETYTLQKSSRYELNIARNTGMYNKERFKDEIWDTAGQERFKTLRTPFYRGSDICLLTYAVDDKVSFRNLSMWKNEFLYYADVKENTHFPFIVVGNKCDVSNEERKVSQLEMETWCNENGISSCIETSAKSASNVQEAFKLAVQFWLKAEIRAEKNEYACNDTVDLTKRNADNRSSCCIGSSEE